MSETKLQPVLTFGGPQAVEQISTDSEIWFNAPLTEVWDKIWQGMNDWWPHRFKPGVSRVTVDLRVGGLWQELFDDQGHGAVYGILTYVDEYKMVAGVGQWGMFGAVWSGGYYKFEERDGGTLLKTHGETMGIIPPEVLEGRKSGSRHILDKLKLYIERGVKYQPPVDSESGD